MKNIITLEKKQEIAKMYKKGYGRKEIATKFGVAEASVYYITHPKNYKKMVEKQNEKRHKEIVQTNI